MFLALRLTPRLVQAPRLQLKLQHTCATCRMAWPSSDFMLEMLMEILFCGIALTSKYQWCICGRIHDEAFARDRNYRARWRRRRRA